jgi:acetylornithine deacetylase/succinyl-diaminopimelate desuccinylase-like protein
MPDPELVQRAKDLVELLSRKPRFAGSPEETNARQLCRSELERAGFECAERPFEYSQWPGRWGVPVAAVIQTATIFLVARTALHQGPLVALIVGAALYAALLFASADAKRRWIAALPVQRAGAVNLEAGRGNPMMWLVAHLDSKSQTVPMLIRIASSIGIGAVTVVATLVLLFSLLTNDYAMTAWRVVEVAAVIVALPSILCWVRNESPGAVDNASGVAAVVLAVQSLSNVRDLGVLITSGEELGLAGARVWAGRAEDRRIVVLNCDTVDDVGGWRLMYSGAIPARIKAAAEAISSSTVPKPAIGPLIPGILADSMAFGERGIESVTISRGTLSTLARIHTRRDTSKALTGRGVAEASALLAALTRELA